MQAMTDPKELDELCPGESKRQREALRRKLDRGGTNVGLISQLPESCFRPTMKAVLNMTHCRPPARTPGKIHECQEQHGEAHSSNQGIGVYRNIVVTQCFLRFDLLKMFIMDPISGVRHGREPLCGATSSADSYFWGLMSKTSCFTVAFCLFPVRQAKEKSKGEWIEKSLCDLEKQYSSPEDREWLEHTIVKSKPPSFPRITFVLSKQILTPM